MENQDAIHPIHTEYEIRQAKVQALRKKGIEPWPNPKEVNAVGKDVKDEFKDDIESRVYELSGRVMTIRGHGKSIFATIQDRSGTLQVYLKQGITKQESFDIFKDFIDIGDIVWFQGTSFKTKMGEVTLRVSDCVLTSKSLHPLPEKFHGLTDVETKYRKRYLDLISNAQSRERFLMRSHIVRLMRSFFDDHEFIEVETPMLHPIPGGAAAKPFVTHHNALNAELYLRIAPELYLKRLVIGGFERVYEINRNFRNEGVSTKHNPEFTMVEFYAAHQDYHFMMDFVEKMIKRIASRLVPALHLPFGDHVLDFEKSFDQLTIVQAIEKYSSVTSDKIQKDTIDATLAAHNIFVPNKNASLGEKHFILFEELVESKLIQPTYIIDMPIEVSPLAKRTEKNPLQAARFELFIAGMEIANGFNELNDPMDQADRFKHQGLARDAGDSEAHVYDQDYITALEHGLPPTVGVGIGIDRLVMILTNTQSIKDIILFPTLKQHNK